MKKRLCTAICMVVLIALLSVAFFWKGDNNNKEKEKAIQEISKELLAEIDFNDITNDTILESQEKTAMSYEECFHVSAVEEKIYMGVRYFTQSDNSYNDGFVFPLDDSYDAADDSYHAEVSDKSDSEGKVILSDEGLCLYEICRENGAYRKPERIECNDYYINDIYWDEEQMYFLGTEKAEIQAAENKISKESYKNKLYRANIVGTNITDVQQIELTESIVPDGGFAFYEGKVLFAGISEGSDAIEKNHYIGKIKDNALTDITELEGIPKDAEVLSARYLNGGREILAEMFYSAEDPLGGYITGKFRYVFADLSGSKVTKLEEQDFSEYFDGFDDFDVNCRDNIFYYLEDDEAELESEAHNVKVKIYKMAYGDSVQNIFHLTANEVTADENETKEYHSGDYSYDAYDKGSFELELRNKTDKSLKSGVWYEIFVRSFADSDGDGIGDFNGVTQKLDYLKELGVDGIWLMPVNASPSYHGYDVTDYMTLNSEYGTEEDFKRLLDEAHKRDMKVIMDFVINHTSSEHPWFKAAILDENSEYRNYYRWVAENDSVDFSKNDTSNWGSSVWQKVGDSYYYAVFGSGMPDLNYNNPSVREEIRQAARKWLELGVDGFRLDAAMHIYGANEFKQEENPTESNIQWWNEFALYCESINPNVYLVGEAWNDNEVLEEYVQPFDTKFNFTFEQEMLKAISKGTAVSETESEKNLADLQGDILERYSSVDTNYLDGVFGTNHDQNRIMSQLESEDKAKLAANIYLTLPGNPFIYYGEELGMFGEKPDEMIRTPFKWSSSLEKNFNTSWISDSQNTYTPSLEEQMQDEKSMYHFYKQLISVRKSNSALMNGDYKADSLNNDNIMAYIREDSEQKLLVIHNFSGDSQTVDLCQYNLGNVVYSFNCDSLRAGQAIELTDGKLALDGNASVIFEIK